MMKMFSKELVNKLDNTKLAKKPIQGTHWYSILANPDYVQKFSYISVDTPDRETLIVDDDDNMKHNVAFRRYIQRWLLPC